MKMLKVSFARPGPPAVSANGMSMIFSASTRRSRMVSASSGRSSGRVMCQSTSSQRLVSSWAAS